MTAENAPTPGHEEAVRGERARAVGGELDSAPASSSAFAAECTLPEP